MSKMSDRDLELREHYLWDLGPEQGDEEMVLGPVPAFIAGLAQLASIGLFVAMVAVWAAIGSGA